MRATLRTLCGCSREIEITHLLPMLEVSYSIPLTRSFDAIGTDTFHQVFYVRRFRLERITGEVYTYEEVPEYARDAMITKEQLNKLEQYEAMFKMAEGL